MRDSLIIIPTYNEKENVALMTETIFALNQGFEILYIDDNSPDNTAAAIAEMQQKYTGMIHLIQRPGKLGLGTAYIAGFKWAIEKQYQYIYEMDCDFSHNPDDLMRLKKACQDGADVAVGSR